MVTLEEAKRGRIAEIREKRAIKQRNRQKRKKRLKITAIGTLIAVTTVSLGVVYNVSAKEVTITEINEFTGVNESKKVVAWGGNVEEVLENNGLTVNETDRLNLPADKPVADSDEIIITRGKRVTIKVGEQESVATITKADAAEALAEAGYATGTEDSITSDGDTIELISVSKMDESVNEKIERGVEYVDDPDLPKGQERVVDEGEDGVKEIKQKVTYLNGQESERTVESETVTSEPKNRVIARGTAEPTPTPKPQKKNPSPSTKTTVTDDGGTVNGYKYSRKITMTATAYSTDPSENAGYSTSAMGNPLGYGIVAVDPKVVPLGSKVYVTAPDGSWTYGVASAEDTGGAIKGNKIDLCYPTNANAFGRKSCVVYILE